MRDNARETVKTGNAQVKVGEDESVKIIFFSI